MTTPSETPVTSTPPVVPFEEIALALSGGGFRAASFSLGCLTYLQRISFKGAPMLTRVKFISSASGGSITNIYYALCNQEGTKFIDFFRTLSTFLAGDDTVAKVFDNLQSNDPWRKRPDKGRNLINAFAVTYDNTLFNGKLLEDIATHKHSHLDEICVNATDFSYGITFRFQTGSGRNGNGEIVLKESVAKKLKLGDILAASSCFPLGFEPIMLPFDFAHAGATCGEIRDATTHSQVVGLMDGGITDNQGIYSFLEAEKRKCNTNEGKGFDTFLYCDVASPFIDDYELPQEKKSLFGQISIQRYIQLLKYVSPALLIACVYLLITVTTAWWLIVLTTLASLSTIIYVASAIFYQIKKKQAKKDKSTWLITLFKFINKILFTRSSAVKQMIEARIKSAGILVGDVYLKQIRRLTIKTLLQNERSGKKWQLHSRGVILYELTTINTERSLKAFEGLKDRNGKPVNMDPSTAMKAIADDARIMDTTLWFDENHVKSEKRDKLIAAGQFTMCYNLIEYICHLEKNKMTTPELIALRNKLVDDWNLFQDKPMGLSTPDTYSVWN
jgi:predicted acylesterase/phospholipase RssA